MPMAESLSPTVWRHTVSTGTSCSMVPSRSIRKCEHTPGQLLELHVGHVAGEQLARGGGGGRDGEVLDDRARLEVGARPPVVALGVLLGLAPALLVERDQRLADRRLGGHRPRGRRGLRRGRPLALGLGHRVGAQAHLGLARRGLGLRLVSASGQREQGQEQDEGRRPHARETYHVGSRARAGLASQLRLRPPDGRARAAGRGVGLRGDAGGRQPEPQRRRLGGAGAGRRGHRAPAPRPRRHQPGDTPPGGHRLGRRHASGGDRRPRPARARARRLRAHPDRPPAGPRGRARAGRSPRSRPTCRARRPTRTASPAGSPGCPSRARRRCPCTWRPPGRT